jgi:hypothetical protein
VGEVSGDGGKKIIRKTIKIKSSSMDRFKGMLTTIYIKFNILAGLLDLLNVLK